MEDEIFELIGRLITTLQDLAIDERHTPRLYARFLAGLLTKHRKGGAGVGGRMQPQPPASQLAHGSPSQLHGGHQQPTSLQYSGTTSQGTIQPGFDAGAMQMNLPNVSIPPPVVSTPPNPPLMDVPVTLDHAQEGHFAPLGIEVTADVGMEDLFSDASTLATMRALNDAWWGNMMMPGCVQQPFVSDFLTAVLNRFTWPDAPLMNGFHDMAGLHGGLAGFPVTETSVAM